MDKLVLRIKEPELCYVFARNARRNGRDDLVMQAYRRAVDLRAAAYGAASDAEFYAVRAIYAYEEALGYSRGRRVRATGTWQTVRRLGLLTAVQRRVAGGEDEHIRPVLQAMGMPDYSFQAVVAAYPEAFAEDVAA